MEGPGRRLKERAEQLGGRFAALALKLVDVGDGRVSAMDVLPLQPPTFLDLPLRSV
jgi:hypothetical protein